MTKDESPAQRPYALVIAHENGMVHPRTPTIRYPQAAALLHAARLEFEVDFVWQDDGAYVADVRVAPGPDPSPGDAGLVARILQDAGWWVFADETSYNSTGPGPLVRFRRSGASSPTGRSPCSSTSTSASTTASGTSETPTPTRSSRASHAEPACGPPPSATSGGSRPSPSTPRTPARAGSTPTALADLGLHVREDTFRPSDLPE